MLRYFSTYFWFCLLLFSFNQFLERAGIFIPYVHAYLDDLLCPGIVLGFALFVQQQFTFRNRFYLFNYGHLVFFVIWYGLLFEVVFPAYDSRHYSDFWDVAAYALGSVGFHFWGNREASSMLRGKIAEDKGRLRSD